MMGLPTGACSALTTALLAIALSSMSAAAQENEYQNLQALPEDISRDDLGDTMLGSAARRVGADAAVREFRRIHASEPDSVLSYSVLDGIGWRTFRQDREAEALVLFHTNRESFPDLCFTLESLVEAQFGAGEISREEIIAVYEGWLEEHPGHRMAQDQLTNLRRR